MANSTVQMLSSEGFDIPNFHIEEAQWVVKDLGQVYAHKLGAVYCVLEIRQYDFGYHNAAFQEFDDQVTSVDAGPAEIKAWIDTHPEAVAWALEFSDIDLSDAERMDREYYLVP